MGDQLNAQSSGQRIIVDSFDREFARLSYESGALVAETGDEVLYSIPGGTLVSVGEAILRCAAEVEQTFGGITANLWDDPFEWTLPEHLSTAQKVIEHLSEVEALRQRAFTSFPDDQCLQKQVSTPGGTRPLIDLLLVTLVRATRHHTQAVTTLNVLSGIKAPGFII